MRTTAFADVAIAAALAITVGRASAVPVPALEPVPPTLCKPGDPPDPRRAWQPDLAAVRAVEARLPAYFGKMKDDDPNRPARAVFSRHYEGIVEKGRRYIVGTFYPVGQFDFAALRWRKTDCPAILDGGNSVWTLWFDVKAGRIVSLSINGVA